MREVTSSRSLAAEDSRLTQWERRIRALEQAISEILAKNLPILDPPEDSTAIADGEEAGVETLVLDESFKNPAFYGPEKHPRSGLFFRWLGPLTEAAIVVSLPRTRALSVEVEVLTVIEKEILEGLDIGCDEEWSHEKKISEGANGSKVVTAVFDPPVGQKLLPFTVINLRVPRLSDLRSTGDQRQVGVGIHRITVRHV